MHASGQTSTAYGPAFFPGSGDAMELADVDSD